MLRFIIVRVFMSFSPRISLCFYTTCIFMGWRRQFCDGCSECSFYCLDLFKSRLSYMITEPSSPTYIAEYITICEIAMSE